MDEQKTSPLTIGISFSGGGARGSAHIGVLQALLDHGIRPGVVAGTSAGSVIGAMYTAGKSTDEMLDFIKHTSTYRLLRLGLPSKGLTKLTYLRDRLAEFILDDSFEELDLPLYVAITNLNAGKVEMRSSGPLLDVVMASSSIPLIFEPVDIGGNLYADGGLLCNLPVSPLVGQCDFIIGVNVIPSSAFNNRQLNGFFNVAIRCFDLSILANTHPEAALCDYVLEPPNLEQFHIFQFARYKELYDLGYTHTVQALPGIQAAMREKERLLAHTAQALPNAN